MTNRTRQEEIRAIHKKHRLFYELFGGLVLLIIGIFIGAMFFGDGNQDYHMNLFTEGMGIVATVIIINRWYVHRDRERLKRRLVREAGSRSNHIAISAVEQLQDKGWLRIGANDGLLQGARLHNANLQGANLYMADLREADLTGANLREAYLRGAFLRGTYLIEADLQRADLIMGYLNGANLNGADLQGAYLTAADLRGANLTVADLRGAYLNGADLQGANLTAANLRETNLTDAKLQGVTLPDGNKYTDNIDIKKFIDPTHPEFAETLEKINEKINEIRREVLQELKL